MLEQLRLYLRVLRVGEWKTCKKRKEEVEIMESYGRE